MAAGAPVVALRTGGLPEVIKEGISGRLVEADGREVQAILDALIPMIGDSSLRRELSRGARETFQRLFTLDIMIDGVERALKSALEKKETAGGT
jgi:glycosyltransferase involved in cell wall biosynthesis